MPNEILEELTTLADKIAKDKPRITDEAKTRTAFVNPFLKILGYKLDDTRMIMPEYDVGYNKDKKVDYAILYKDKPLVLLEIKHHSENLSRHINQLKNYCKLADCKFGILTNGLEYRFFTDTQEINTMDSEPFMVINLKSKINDEQLEILNLFRYGNLQNNIQQIRNKAESMLDKIAIRKFLETNIINPSDKVTKFVLKHIKGTQSAKKINEFKIHIAHIFGEMMTSKTNTYIYETQNANLRDSEKTISNKEKQIFNIVREILTKELMENKVNLTFGNRTTNYIPVEIEGGKYICGIWNNCSAISIPNKEHKFGYERFKIEDINDIYKYKNELAESLKMRLK